MQKKIISLAVAGAILSPFAAMAEDAPSPLTFNVGATSDYLFRGVSQTHGKPAVSAGVDYAFSNGFYVGAWASTITWVKDWLGSGSTEVDLYGGYKGTFAEGSDWAYDVGLIHYNYPSHGTPTKGTSATVAGQLANPNTTEVYGAITYKWLTAKYSHAISSHFIGWVPTTAANGPDATRNTRGSNYLELNAAYDLGDGWGVSGHVGHQKVKNVVAVTTYGPDANYTDWNVGVTKDVGFGVVGLTYSDTNAKGTCGNPPTGTNISAYCWGEGMQNATATNWRDVAKGTVVLSFKKSF